MTTYTHEIEIDVPTDYAFEWGLVPENWRRCMPALTAIEHIEETEEGDRYQSTFKILGRSVTDTSLFKIIEPNAHAMSVMEGPDMTGEMHYYYTETDSGTTVRFVAEFDDAESLFERALQPVFTRYLNRQFRNHLRTMKDLAEAEHAAADAATADAADVTIEGIAR